MTSLDCPLTKKSAKTGCAEAPGILPHLEREHLLLSKSTRLSRLGNSAYFPRHLITFVLRLPHLSSIWEKKMCYPPNGGNPSGRTGAARGHERAIGGTCFPRTEPKLRGGSDDAADDENTDS